MAKLDLALEKIMKNGNSGSSKKSKSEAANDEEEGENDDYDGNEWDD